MYFSLAAQLNDHDSGEGLDHKHGHGMDVLENMDGMEVESASDVGEVESKEVYRLRSRLIRGDWF